MKNKKSGVGKNIGGLMIGVGSFIFIMFFILPVFGVDMPNPFQPVATATVTIESRCGLIPMVCEFNEETTTVNFYTGYVKSVLPLATYGLPCYLLGQRFGGADINIRFDVPTSKYSATKGPFVLCGDPHIEHFTFNTISGVNSYPWMLTVINSKTGQPLYTKTGVWT